MSDAELLLSEEFVVFSEKIKEIYDKKLVEKENIKKLYADHQKKMKELEKEALQVQQDFELWKKEQTTKDG